MSLNFLENCIIKDIFTGSRHLVTVNVKAKTETVLKLLRDRCIVSCPVVDDTEKVVGVADLLKINMVAVGMHPELGKAKVSSVDPAAKAPLSSVLETEREMVLGEKFAQLPIGEVVEMVNKFNDPLPAFYSVTLETPLQTLLDMFYLGVHRVLILDEKEHAVNQISQSDLLQVLGFHLPFFDPKLKKATLAQLRLFEGRLQAITFKEDDMVLHAMHSMLLHRFSSVPILNSEGKLTMIFSTSNLRGLTRYNFGALSRLTIKQFLQDESNSTQLSSRETPFFANAFAQRAFYPTSVSLDTTFEHVVALMAASRLHRVTVVNEKDQVLHVLSLGDLFQVFLPWGAPRKFEE